MIKILAPAHRHPRNRSLADFHRYWARTHGPMFANTPSLRRYVQHLTLPAAYGHEPAPTFDGASVFWYDELQVQRPVAADPEVAALLRAVLGFTPEVHGRDAAPPSPAQQRQTRLARAVAHDDAQLFDRATEWPMHRRRAYVVARERVVLAGSSRPSMVKVLAIVSKLPGLALTEFFEHWQREHGELVRRLPGLRRYVQNHGVADGYALGAQTHDGWSEMWFEDLPAVARAVASPQWRAVVAAGRDLFAQPIGVVVASETVQKDRGWTYHDWGVGGMSEDEIRARLRQEGYGRLADHPALPGRLRSAAADQALAVWTEEHLVTIDESDLDVRPERNGAAA